MSENIQSTGPNALVPVVFDYELADGNTGRLRVLNRSLIAWDETRGKRKWPSAEEAPSLWQTFVLWHALRGLGEYSGDFNQFKDADCVQIEMVDQDALDEEDTVPPTVTTGHGSVSSWQSPVVPSVPEASLGGTRPTTD